MTPLLNVCTTVQSQADAERIARAVLAQGLAACVQLSPIESFYQWDGAVQHEREIKITLKSTAGQYGALEQLLRDIHPYHLPAIYALPVAHAEARYAEWVAAEAGRH